MKTILSYLFIGIFCFLVSCGGGGGNPGDPTNVPPIANAGAGLIVNPGSEVILDGSSSKDSDGRIVSYQWKQKQGESVALSDANSATTTFVAPNITSLNELVFQLTV